MKWIKGILTVMFVVFAANAWGAPICNVASTPVSFGGYNVYSSAPDDAVGSVTITCDAAGVPYSVSLDAGVNSAGVFNPRLMKITGSANTLNYNLYLNPTRTQIWGDGTNSSFTRTGVLTGTSGTLTVYGRIPARQNAYVGAYTDSVTVTVLW